MVSFSCQLGLYADTPIEGFKMSDDHSFIVSIQIRKWQRRRSHIIQLTLTHIIRSPDWSLFHIYADFTVITRQCWTSVSTIRPGCRFTESEEFVCVYLCSQSLCNGVGIVPPPFDASPTATPVTASSTFPSTGKDGSISGTAAESRRTTSVLTVLLCQILIATCLFFVIVSDLR